MNPTFYRIVWLALLLGVIVPAYPQEDQPQVEVNAEGAPEGAVEAEEASPEQKYTPNVVFPDETERLQAIATELEKLLGHKFEVYSEDHWGIIYDTEITLARQTGTILETTYQEFYNNMGRRGIQPEPLKQRMICLLIRDQTDYLKYGESLGRGGFPKWSAGVFTHGTKYIQFFDQRTGEQFQQWTSAIEGIEQQKIEMKNQREKEREDARKQRQAPGNRKPGYTPEGISNVQYAEQMKDLEEQKKRIQNQMARIADGSNLTVTTHEATHQLAFHTGVQNLESENPFWVSEGLATNFEMQKRGAPFAFKKNQDRLDVLQSAHERDKLIPWEEFVVTMHAPQGGGGGNETVGNMYGQAWGLYSFLMATKKEKLAAYLKDLADGTTDHKATFEQHFGPIDKLALQLGNYHKLKKKDKASDKATKTKS